MVYEGAVLFLVHYNFEAFHELVIHRKTAALNKYLKIFTTECRPKLPPTTRQSTYLWASELYSLARFPTTG